ncbi:MAG: VanZ family protein [Deltaproteobacteria bacterium]|nr:VanZ family protein [Deltaproteobacteria bacterium]
MANTKCDRPLERSVILSKAKDPIVIRIIRYWLPLIAYAGLIFYLSSLPRLSIPQWFPHIDKAAHFLEYGGLGFLCVRVVRFRFREIRKVEILGALLGLAYGATDEIHQFFVPGRESSLTDLLVDGIGAAVGAVFYFYLRGKIFRGKEPAV